MPVSLLTSLAKRRSSAEPVAELTFTAHSEALRAVVEQQRPFELLSSRLLHPRKSLMKSL